LLFIKDARNYSEQRTENRDYFVLILADQL